MLAQSDAQTELTLPLAHEHTCTYVHSNTLTQTHLALALDGGPQLMGGQETIGAGVKGQECFFLHTTIQSPMHTSSDAHSHARVAWLSLLTPLEKGAPEVRHAPACAHCASMVGHPVTTLGRPLQAGPGMGQERSAPRPGPKLWTPTHKVAWRMNQCVYVCVNASSAHPHTEASSSRGKAHQGFALMSRSKFPPRCQSMKGCLPMECNCELTTMSKLALMSGFIPFAAGESLPER